MIMNVELKYKVVKSGNAHVKDIRTVVSYFQQLLKPAVWYKRDWSLKAPQKALFPAKYMLN